MMRLRRRCKSNTIDETGQYLQYFNDDLGDWQYNGTSYSILLSNPVQYLVLAK
jgi:hypothetical protein